MSLKDYLIEIIADYLFLLIFCIYNIALIATDSYRTYVDFFSRL